MGNLVDYQVYHGTSTEAASDIKKNGFQFAPSPSHWLGNGIYFFKDRRLAEWWATDIKKCPKPAIIDAVLSTSPNKVLDLRDFNGLIKFLEIKLRLNKSVTKSLRDENPTREIKMEEYRCRLFDQIFQKYKYDIIIGCFDSENKSYLDYECGLSIADYDFGGSSIKGTLSYLKLMFSEIQFCVNTSRKSQVINIMN